MRKLILLGAATLSGAAIMAAPAVHYRQNQPTAEQQQAAQQAMDSGFYVGLQLGAALPMSDFKNISNTGFNTGISAGYRFNKMFRMEGQLSVAFNGVANQPKQIVNFTWNNTYVMANAYFDMPVSGPVTPYVGGGVGFDVFGESANIGSQWIDLPSMGTYFAFQGIAGVNYSFSPATSVGLEYRYVSAPSVKNSPTVKNINNSIVNVTLNYNF